jgi:hypothetical protein
MRIIKPAGKSVAQTRKAKRGATMHGSEPNRALHRAQGKCMRADSKPRGFRIWGTRRP